MGDFGSMFDDEEEGQPSPPSVAKDEAKAPAAGFLNDEAKALIDEKVQAAADLSKRAGKAGIAAAVRAGGQLVDKAKEAKAQVDSRSAGANKRLLIIIGVVVGLAAAGSATWFYMGREEAAAVVSDFPVVAPRTSVDPVQPAAPQVVEPAPDEFSESNFMVPSSSALMAPPEPEVVDVKTPESIDPPTPKVEAPAPQLSVTPKQVEPVKAKPAPAADGPTVPRPARVEPVKTKVLGKKEQEQIDAINAAFGN